MALPGGPLEICFSFDTTISMTSYVDQVKARLQDMMQKLKSDVPGIKMALFAHGDYYQERFNNTNPYITKHVDFTDDVAELCTFIKGAEPTLGGDWDECYELVLKEAREKLTWTPGTNRVLVMIGDASPHKPEDYGNKFEGDVINWRDEVDKLLKDHIRCYGVYCNTPKSGIMDRDFFKTLSLRGNGSSLELEKFDSIFDFMMAICYREQGGDALFAYEAEVRGRLGGAAKDVHHMFTTLKKSVSNASVEAPKQAVSIANTTATSRPTAAPDTKTSVRVKANKLPATLKRPTKAVRKQNNNHKIMTRAGEGPAHRTRRNKTFTKAFEKSKDPSYAARVVNRRALYKSKPTAVKRLRRENVPETNFALRDFPWSSWKVVRSRNAKHGLACKYTCGNRKERAIEYAADTIFDGKTTRPALYEFAVRMPGCNKRVVYVKSTSGFTAAHWRSVLFPSKSVRKQIDNVIQKQAGDLLVRRLVLKKFRKYSEVESTLNHYDYVWAPEGGVDKYRPLKCDQYVISEEMEVD